MSVGNHGHMGGSLEEHVHSIFDSKTYIYVYIYVQKKKRNSTYTQYYDLYLN